MKKILVFLLLAFAMQSRAQENAQDTIDVSATASPVNFGSMDSLNYFYSVSDTFIKRMNASLAKHYPATFHSLSMQLSEEPDGKITLKYYAIVVSAQQEKAVPHIIHRGAIGSSEFVIEGMDIEKMVRDASWRNCQIISYDYQKYFFDHLDYLSIIQTKSGVLYVVSDNFFKQE
ncbi:MAG TPA: hypothetical protein PK950_02825, partial [Candidatus Paceibacterota bacterium]|nr:hypothetical protein [Candidatus Paceibacterota bacterium]